MSFKRMFAQQNEVGRFPAYEVTGPTSCIPATALGGACGSCWRARRLVFYGLICLLPFRKLVHRRRLIRSL
jgi:hypothetical protein